MQNPLVVVLDNVRSAYNVGSVFRCCDAFGVDLLLLCGITAYPPHKEIQKTALGATEHVAWRYEHDSVACMQALQTKRCIAVDTHIGGVPLHRFSAHREESVVLVFGHEVSGIHPEVLSLCSERLEIPQVGVKNSLNISVTAGIVLWKMAEKRLL